MKATITFDLTDPGDMKGFQRVLTLPDVYNALWEMDLYLNEQDGMGGPDDIEAIRERWYRIMETHGISINE